MPLQISEIGIHIAVGDATAAASGRSVPHEQADAMGPEQIEALVRACVHDVLRTLRLREDR